MATRPSGPRRARLRLHSHFLPLRLIGLFAPLRATEHEEALGMDVAPHGEDAYATGEGAILLSTDAGLQSAIPVTQP